VSTIMAWAATIAMCLGILIVPTRVLMRAILILIGLPILLFALALM